MRSSTKYSALQIKLKKLRAVLAHETMISHLITTEPELFPDPTDQAAADHELNVTWSVKMRTLDKLRRIEQALSSLHEHSYGICRRCGLEIPYARLKVQPDTLYCVPCLTRMEQGALGN
jgi:RNA polymerase-binding protein DksA